MVIFKNNIRRLCRDKFTFMAILILPMIFISFSLFAFGSSAPLRAVVIDYDNTELTSLLKERLDESITLVDVQEQDIKQQLIRGKLDFAIKIEQGFTADLIAGRNVRLQSMNIKETNTSIPIKFFTENFINSAKNIAVSAKGNEQEFYKGMKLYLEDKVKADYLFIENTERDTKPNTYASLGFVVMFMMFLSTNAATLVLEDKQLKTYERVLSSPIKPREYFVQNLLSFIAVMLTQVVVIFALLKFLFRADLGPSTINLVGLFAIFSVTAVAVGVAISSFAKDLRQSAAISNLIIVPMCMLGGCFWPREIMPQFLQQLGRFMPVTWVLEATEKLLYGNSFGNILVEISILLLFALVFLIIGSNKRVMMSTANKH